MAFIPKKTVPLVLTLAIFLVLLLIVRLSPPAPPDSTPSPNTPTLPPAVTPTVFPEPTQASTLSAALTGQISPTPAVNPKNGWHIYQNQQYRFKFDHPPSWTVTEFQPTQPIVLVGIGTEAQITAFSITLASWPFDNSFPTATPSAFAYQDWQGTQLTTQEDGLPVTVITAIKDGFRATYIQSGTNQSTINTYLKPLLSSFTINPSPTQPPPSQNPGQL